jgi:hypothetical protein
MKTNDQSCLVIEGRNGQITSHKTETESLGRLLLLATVLNTHQLVHPAIAKAEQNHVALRVLATFSKGCAAALICPCLPSTPVPRVRPSLF